MAVPLGSNHFSGNRKTSNQVHHPESRLCMHVSKVFCKLSI